MQDVWGRDREGAAVTLNIDRLDGLLEKASPAKWRANTKPHAEAVRANNEAVSLHGPDCLIYVVSRDYANLPETWQRQRADCELIAALRNAAPELIRKAREHDDLVQALMRVVAATDRCTFYGPADQLDDIDKARQLLARLSTPTPAAPGEE